MKGGSPLRRAPEGAALWTPAPLRRAPKGAALWTPAPLRRASLSRLRAGRRILVRYYFLCGADQPAKRTAGWSAYSVWTDASFIQVIFCW